jgi:hypothetical protein
MNMECKEISTILTKCQRVVGSFNAMFAKRKRVLAFNAKRRLARPVVACIIQH